jgi:hypothetical protein
MGRSLYHAVRWRSLTQLHLARNLATIGRLSELTSAPNNERREIESF